MQNKAKTEATDESKNKNKKSRIKIKAKANNTTEDDIIRAYASANEDLFRAQRDMYGIIQSAKKIGLSDEQIYRSLRQRSNIGRSEFGFLLEGRFRPISLNDKLFKQVYEESVVDGKPRVTKELPGRALSNIYGRLVNQKLTQENLGFEQQQRPQRSQRRRRHQQRQ